jgi:ubiquitin carboxyl-terminal hydrolase 36/42
VQNNSLDNGLVSSKKICSEDSSQMFCSEDSAQLISSEDSVLVLNKELCNGNLQRDMGIKSTKHLKRPVVNLFFGSKQLLLGSLKPRKRRKHKRIKRQLKSSIDAESIATDQQTSTSETVHAQGTSFASRRQKRSRNSASSEDGVSLCNKKQNLGDFTSSVGLTTDKQDIKDSTLSNGELARLGPRSIASPDSGKCLPTDEKDSWHFDLLTRGLRQITGECVTLV